MIDFKDYEWATKDFVSLEVEKILKTPVNLAKNEFNRFILSCIDLTTLEGNDTTQKVKSLCEKAYTFSDRNILAPKVAAVCVYPVFAQIAKKLLENKDIKTACVAGAFPAGQSPIHIKTAEVKYAIEEGADEIDIVISRGALLEGRYNQVFDEISAIKEVCGKEIHLKVILETGELENYQNILIASDLAICAGADFIKTSTGKISIGATESAAFLMLYSIRKHFEKTGKMIGFKPAGGISTPEQAENYVKLTHFILGNGWLDKKYFRIGGSRLAEAVYERIF